jgi:hypothetical protein
MGRACSTSREKRKAYRFLVWKPDGRRPLGRPRHRWVDNIRMDLGELELEQVESSCESANEPACFIKC